MKRRLGLIFIALTLSAFFARGQSGESPAYSEEVFRKRGEEHFKALDVDKDGYLIGQEIPGEIRFILSQSMASPDTRLNLRQFLKYREEAYLLQVVILFKQHDRDEDGFLQKHEMPLSLMKRLGKYSSGGDRVNFQDFLRFMRDRDFPSPPPPPRTEPAQAMEPAPATPLTIDHSNLYARPTVYRAGKLPKGLPEWFEKLDTDKDGQVALFEWRNAGKSLEEFEQWDCNGDGLITFEEALYKLRVDYAARAKKGSS